MDFNSVPVSTEVRRHCQESNFFRVIFGMCYGFEPISLTCLSWRERRFILSDESLVRKGKFLLRYSWLGYGPFPVIYLSRFCWLILPNHLSECYIKITEFTFYVTAWDFILHGMIRLGIMMSLCLFIPLRKSYRLRPFDIHIIWITVIDNTDNTTRWTSEMVALNFEMLCCYKKWIFVKWKITWPPNKMYICCQCYKSGI